MLICHRREKLIDAILYLTNRVVDRSRDSIFKLLFLFDVEHYRQTLRTSTGLRYYAWSQGPVPGELMEELDAPRPDFSDVIDLALSLNNDHTFSVFFNPLKDFRNEHLTRREVSILETLVDRYGRDSALLAHDVCGAGSLWDGLFNGPVSDSIFDSQTPRSRYSVIRIEEIVDAEQEARVFEEIIRELDVLEKKSNDEAQQTASKNDATSIVNYGLLHGVTQAYSVVKSVMNDSAHQDLCVSDKLSIVIQYLTNLDAVAAEQSKAGSPISFVRDYTYGVWSGTTRVLMTVGSIQRKKNEETH